MEKISEHIAQLRSEKKNATYYYRHGGCFQFYELLKKKFPEAQAWYDGNHVVTLIQGRFWDVGGLVMYPIEAEPRIFKDAHNWANPCFLNRAEYIKGDKCYCPECELNRKP